MIYVLVWKLSKYEAMYFLFMKLTELCFGLFMPLGSKIVPQATTSQWHSN